MTGDWLEVTMDRSTRNVDVTDSSECLTTNSKGNLSNVDVTGSSERLTTNADVHTPVKTIDCALTTTSSLESGRLEQGAYTDTAQRTQPLEAAEVIVYQELSVTAPDDQTITEDRHAFPKIEDQHVIEHKHPVTDEQNDFVYGALNAATLPSAAPLSTSSTSATPLSTASTSSTPLSTLSASATPLSTSSASAMPLSTSSTSAMPLSTSSTSATLLSTSPASVTPLSTSSTSATPLSTSLTSVTPLSISSTSDDRQIGAVVQDTYERNQHTEIFVDDLAKNVQRIGHDVTAVEEVTPMEDAAVDETDRHTETSHVIHAGSDNSLAKGHSDVMTSNIEPHEIQTSHPAKANRLRKLVDNTDENNAKCDAHDDVVIQKLSLPRQVNDSGMETADVAVQKAGYEAASAADVAVQKAGYEAASAADVADQKAGYEAASAADVAVHKAGYEAASAADVAVHKAGYEAASAADVAVQKAGYEAASAADVAVHKAGYEAASAADVAVDDVLQNETDPNTTGTLKKSKFSVERIDERKLKVNQKFSRHGVRNKSNLTLDVTKLPMDTNLHCDVTGGDRNMNGSANAVQHSSDVGKNSAEVANHVTIEMPSSNDVTSDVTSDTVTAISDEKQEIASKNPGEKTVTFKPDLLDSDVVYTWTLEKRNRYAAEIRKIKMTLESRPPQPADYIVLSCMVLCCCNPLFGALALYLSLKIEPKYSKGQYDTAKRFSKISRILAISGIAASCIIVITCLAVYWPSFEKNVEHET